MRRIADFFRGDLGKSALGLAAAVVAFCYPQLPGYACGCFALYYAIHRFRPVADWIVEDIRHDLEDT